MKVRYNYYYEDVETGYVTHFDIVAVSRKQELFFRTQMKKTLGPGYFVSYATGSEIAAPLMPVGIHGADDFRNYRLDVND